MMFENLAVSSNFAESNIYTYIYIYKIYRYYLHIFHKILNIQTFILVSGFQHALKTNHPKITTNKPTLRLAVPHDEDPVSVDPPPDGGRDGFWVP